MMKEEDYIFAQNLTRLRIAENVLKEIVQSDDFNFNVKPLVTALRAKIDVAYLKMDNDSNDEHTKERK